MNAPFRLASQTVRMAGLDDPNELARIEAFVAAHEHGTPFHRPVWLEAVARGTGNKAVALLAEPIVTHRRRAESPSFLVWTALCWADDLAYSAGVWVGCVRARRFGPLLPDVRRWAGRSASGRQN